MRLALICILILGSINGLSAQAGVNKRENKDPNYADNRYRIKNLYGSNASEKEIIKIDLNAKTPINTSIENVIYPESRDYSIFSSPSRIQFFDEKIFVLDARASKTLYLFDKQGKYLRKILNGEGPGEAFSVRAFYIDQASKRVLVWDEYQLKMLEYDLDLNYIGFTVLPGMLIKQFQRLKDNTWLVHRRERILANGQDFAFYHYTENFDSALSSIIPIPRGMTGFMLSNPISREIEQETLFTGQFQRNIYSIKENGSVETRYTLDFGEYNILESDFFSSLDRIFELSREGKRVISINHLINGDEYFAFSFVFKGKWEYLIYSKVTQKYWLSSQLTEEMKLPYGKLLSISNDHFVLACKPDDFNNFCDSSINAISKDCKYVDNDHNEILLLFSIQP